MRVYLDYNATAPLVDEARLAMIQALDIVGNPSSVHTEGRQAKKLLEQSRSEIAEAIGASNADIVFVSGATEAAALACAGRCLSGSDIEHEAVLTWLKSDLDVSSDGKVLVDDPQRAVLQLANSETGIVQNLPESLAVSDITQGFGKLPFSYAWSGVEMVFASAHKIGGPRGVGVLVIPQGYDLVAQLRGGGQEMGRRAGTENLIGIAGFAAAAKAQQKALCDGAWDSVTELRDTLETIIEEAAPDTIFIGKHTPRLPNTSCFITPGWKGETQVMAMDLAGFAVSAGSACSSGKVKSSKVLRAMGYFETEAGNACRVSLGLHTTQEEVMRFAQTWVGSYKKMRARAA